MKLDLNEFKQEVHQNAVDHGWWGEEYTDAVVIALIQSEITEAFEEWRADRPMLWHRCKSNAPAEMVVCERCAKCYYREKGSVTDCPDYDAKPEGIAVELIDVVLRILDAAAAWDVMLDDIENVDAALNSKPIKNSIDEYTLPDLVVLLHGIITDARNAKAYWLDMALHRDMSLAVSAIFSWLRAHDIAPEALMREKHEYNKTRPYKHGGKRV